MLILQHVPESFETKKIENWFFRKAGFESPVPIVIFKTHGNLYGLNWLGLFVYAAYVSDNFTCDIYRRNNSFLGKQKIFFSVAEGVKALTQHIAVLAKAPVVQQLPDAHFLLSSTAALRYYNHTTKIRYEELMPESFLLKQHCKEVEKLSTAG